MRPVAAFEGTPFAAGCDRRVGLSPDSDIGISILRRRLVQARSTKSFQVVLSVGVLPDRHLVCDPSERNIGLRTAKLLQRDPGDIVLSGHARGGRWAPTKSLRCRIASRASRIASS